MTNIKYRIDDRLIHGQVITAWSRYYKLEKIIIVDNQVAEDLIQRQIINAVAPSNITVEVLTVQEGYKAILEAREAQASTLVLVKGPEVPLDLIEMGVDIDEIIIGGMQFRDGRKQITRSVFITHDEAKVLWRLYDKDVELIIQIVPTERRSQLANLLDKTFPRGG